MTINWSFSFSAFAFSTARRARSDLMAGYYQNAVMHLRDILEVSFLLDYFHTDKALVAAWKACSESERNRQFSAFRVRTTLDERDGFTEKKRMEHYQLLCNLGAHATFQGFELLRPFAGGDAHCGPYFADRALDATMPSWRKVAVGAAGNFTMFFDPPAYLTSKRSSILWKLNRRGSRSSLGSPSMWDKSAKCASYSNALKPRRAISPDAKS